MKEHFQEANKRVIEILKFGGIKEFVMQPTNTAIFCMLSYIVFGLFFIILINPSTGLMISMSFIIWILGGVYTFFVIDSWHDKKLRIKRD